MIYFAQPVAGGPIKIGTTTNLDARLKQLEYTYKQPLALLATTEGGREREAEIHEHFRHLRFGRTEQFRPAPELMAFIGKPLLVDANPDLVEAMPSLSVMKNLASIRGTDAWKLWLDGLAAKKRMSIAALIDHALVEAARSIGFHEPPPRR